MTDETSDETITPRCRTCGRVEVALTEDDVRRIVREEIEKDKDWRDHLAWGDRDEE